MSNSCWCGQAALEPFSADYGRCAACETLVCTAVPAPADPRVRDEASDFYGWEYFHSDQVRRGVPPIETRARTDLYDRCVYWLDALTRYRLPPARVLELGCAHGGFVALLRQAGYDAVGLDLSPSIVDLARRTFDVPMLVGPVEDQSLEAGVVGVVGVMGGVEDPPPPPAGAPPRPRALQ